MRDRRDLDLTDRLVLDVRIAPTRGEQAQDVALATGQGLIAVAERLHLRFATQSGAAALERVPHGP